MWSRRDRMREWLKPFGQQQWPRVMSNPQQPCLRRGLQCPRDARRCSPAELPQRQKKPVFDDAPLAQCFERSTRILPKLSGRQGVNRAWPRGTVTQLLLSCPTPTELGPGMVAVLQEQQLDRGP